MSDITTALKDLYSHLPWSIQNSDYDTLQWKDTQISKPSLEELVKRADEILAEKPFNEIRTKRNTRLSETDKYATIDYPHPTEEAKQAWLDYRQALRDLPANTTDPENPVWPKAPTP